MPLALAALGFMFASCGEDSTPSGSASTKPESIEPASPPTPPPPLESGVEDGAEDELDLPAPEGPPPDGPRHARIESGDSLARILRHEGLENPGRHALLEALSEHTNPAKVRIGQGYELVFADGQIVAFRLELDALTRIDVSQSEDGWTAEKVERASQLAEVGYQGDIEGSLWRSLEKAGASPTLVAVFVDAFAFDIDFHTDTRAGDRFSVLVSERRADGEFLGYERVLAARYQGARGDFEVYWWQPSPKKAGAYYDAEGKGIKRTFLKSPLKFSRVSSQFNPKRMHPVLHREKGHMGTDYAAPVGAPVWAASDGKIVFRGDKGGAGNMVIILHGNGLKTLYMHLSKFEDGQKVGQRVEQKQVIGYVGMTGLATGPHLHFGVQKNGRYVDPQSVDMQREKNLPKSQRKAFKRKVREYQEAWIDLGGGESGESGESGDQP
jgi:murein DD-endopeptidase MepM/ murein hydrolase activator NlpD